MEPKLSFEKYGPRSRIPIALLIAFGSCALVGYGNFLEWTFASILAISIIFEEEKWAEYTCWVAIIGKIGGAFVAFQKMDLSVEELFSFGTVSELDEYLNDPLVGGVLGKELRAAKLAYIASIVAIALVILYLLCLTALYILIPQYLSRRYVGRGGIVFSIVLLVISSAVSLLAISLAIGYSYLLSMAENVGLNASNYNLNIDVAFLTIVALKIVCLPLGARLYFGLCRKHLKAGRKNSLKYAYAEANLQERVSEEQLAFEEHEETLSNKEN